MSIKKAGNMGRANRAVLVIIFLVLFVFVIGLLRARRMNNTNTDSSALETSAQPENTSAKVELPGYPLRRITDKGGRVAWYHGAQHELIAYDSIVNQLNKNTEIFTMTPEGTQVTCVTCKSANPRGFVGQPSWYPDGEHLVYQAENSNSKHGLYNHMAWGINQDLWFVRKDGTGAELIWESEENHGALHPHFSPDGTKIIFSERIATGVKVLGLLFISPGGENPWDGWQIHIADFDITKTGKEKLSNHTILYAGTKGFYETHGFTADGKIMYSRTEKGHPYVDDVFIANADGSSAQNLTNSPKTWDEHGNFSSSGRGMAFMSSRADPAWRPADGAKALRTELFLQNNTGVIQLTQFNAGKNTTKRYLVSDYDWDTAGNRIAFQVAPVGDRPQNTESPQIWMMDLNSSEP